MTLNTDILNTAVFSDFFQEVNGYAPFPWQVDLVEQVLTNKHAWPQLIDVPTGMGKTALLDIAVFVAAATSTEVGTERLGRRRVFFVVDRRIVVDEAYDHAVLLSKALNEALESGKNTVLSQVANGLKAFAPEVFTPKADSLSSSSTSRIQQGVLPVTRMRGGITWDASWLDRPDIPGIVVGTVDQVGSRILFRGYGISRYRMPIDSALVGTDSLILVDEAHLAQAMVSTINEAHRRDNNNINVPPATIVQMTATSNRQPDSEKEPGYDDNAQSNDSTQFDTYSIDIEKHLEIPEAECRLNAPKKMSVQTANSGNIVKTLTKKSIELLDTEHNAILVVCNTVNRAREVYRALIERTLDADVKKFLNAEIFLLIGRSRPADRDLLVSRLKERFGVHRSRELNAAPAILVATQTVEVGANLDADGLVTESAPWDCLVQRLGRLNRFGKIEDAKCIVVHDGIKKDPIYGEARNATWDYLQDIVPKGGSIDVSPRSCRELQQEVPLEAYAPSPIIPLLTTPILDCWVRTSPVPVPDTPVAPYLHGLKRSVPTVYIAWRDGLIDATSTLERDQDDATADLTALPVRSEELVEVPLYAVRKWMRHEEIDVLSDLNENDDVLDEDTTVKQKGTAKQSAKPVPKPFPVLAWRNDDDASSRRTKSRSTGSWIWIEESKIRVGDTLVVPTERGGLDEYGWAPDSTEPVLDVAEVVRLRKAFSDLPSFGRKPLRPLLRIDEHTAKRLGLSDKDSSKLQKFVGKLRGYFADGNNDNNMEQELLDILEPAIKDKIEESISLASNERIQGTAWTREDLLMLQKWLGCHSVVITPAQDIKQTKASQHYILAPSKNDNVKWTIERDDESPECSSMGTHRVTLKAHQNGVGMRAREIARSLKLGEELVSSIELAAQCHDWGKIESRFQAMLCGGDEYEAMLTTEPLAKSGIDPFDRSAHRLARSRSKLPSGARHEAWSAALVREYLKTSQLSNCDPELIIHLIASHHGRARPWYSPVQDDDPREVDASICGEKITINSAKTVDFDHPARFARLNEKYGRWGLALLESIVRCADMTVSEEESRATQEEKS